MRVAWNHYVKDGRSVDGNRWSRVRGPIGVVVATLIDFEWPPNAPDRFVADNAQEYRFAANGDATYFKQMLLESAQRQAWRMSSNHTGHTDIYKGGGLTSAKGLLKNYANREMWQERGMAIVTVATGIWTRDRLFNAGMVDDDICPRCKLARETPYHRYWLCPANVLIENQFPLLSSDNYVATSEASKSSAQLTRGIVPKTAYPKIPPAPIKGQGKQFTYGAISAHPGGIVVFAALMVRVVRLDPIPGYVDVDGPKFRWK